MTRTGRTLRRGRVAVAVLSVGALSLTACGSSKKTATTPGGGASSGAAASPSVGAPPPTKASTVANGLALAIAHTQKAILGTSRDVDPTSRPAVKGKSIVVISTGQASISSSVPSNAAVEAAKAIGWKVSLYDAQLNPGKYGDLVRQAIAAGAQGIVLDAIDCNSSAQAALQQAKAKGIVVTAIYAFDCSDPLGGGGPSEFSAYVNFGAVAAKNIGAFSESYGGDQANYIIAKSQNKAKIIVIQDAEFTVLKYTYSGFKKVVDASNGTTIVDTVQVVASDLAGGKIVSKIQAALRQHPEATWIKAPYTYATLLGIVPALAASQKAGKVQVMGGEGFLPELDLLRGGKIDAINVISSEWVGWAAVDAMNSIFRKEPTRDSGVGWTIADKQHVPASGPLVPKQDFRSEFKKAWGVG